MKRLAIPAITVRSGLLLATYSELAGQDLKNAR